MGVSTGKEVVVYGGTTVSWWVGVQVKRLWCMGVQRKIVVGGSTGKEVVVYGGTTVRSWWVVGSTGKEVVVYGGTTVRSWWVGVQVKRLWCMGVQQ